MRPSRCQIRLAGGRIKSVNLTHQEIIISQGPALVKICESMLDEIEKMDQEEIIEKPYRLIKEILSEPAVYEHLTRNMFRNQSLVKEVHDDVLEHIRSIKNQIQISRRSKDIDEEWILLACWELEKIERNEDQGNTHIISLQDLEVISLADRYLSEEKTHLEAISQENKIKHVLDFCARYSDDGTAMRAGCMSISTEVIAGTVRTSIEITLNDEKPAYLTVVGKTAYLDMNIPESMLIKSVGKHLREIIDHPYLQCESLIIKEYERTKNNNMDWIIIVFEESPVITLKIPQEA